MTLIQFDDGSGRRIGNAVRFVEELVGKRRPLGFDAVLERNARALRVGTFTGAWSAQTWKTVTLENSTATVSVYNWGTPVTPPSACAASSHYVVFGRANGTQSLVEVGLNAACFSTCHMTLGSVDLTTLPGYDAANIQLLGHGTAGECLQWYSVTTCSTSTAA